MIRRKKLNKPTKGMSGRPEGSKDKFSRENIQATIYEVEAIKFFSNRRNEEETRNKFFK